MARLTAAAGTAFVDLQEAPVRDFADQLAVLPGAAIAVASTVAEARQACRHQGEDPREWVVRQAAIPGIGRQGS